MRKILILFLLTLPAAAAERYIVPVWGMLVHGANATYYGVINATNLNSTEATLRVTKVVPILATPCRACDGVAMPVPPRITKSFGLNANGVAANAQQLDLGAVELESDVPLHVDAEISAVSGERVTWQNVEVARDWITGESMIPRAIPGEAPFKLYLINPNDFAMRFDYHSQYGAAGTTTVPARTTAVVELRDFFCPSGCGGAEQPIGFAFPLTIKADFPYMAAVALPSAASVRIARPLTP